MTSKKVKISDLKRKIQEADTPSELDFTKIPRRVKKIHRGKALTVSKKGNTKNDVKTVSSYSVPESEYQEPNVITVGQLSPLEVYIHELKSKNGIWPVDQKYTQFFVKHSAKKKSLHASKHSFVSRRAIKFSLSDEVHWVYACTCSTSEHALVTNLSDHNNTSFEDFLSEVDYCIHICAMREIISSFDIINEVNASDAFDDHGYIKKVDEISEIGEGLFFLPNQYTICCRTDDGYGVVGAEPGVVRCVTCKYGTTSCSHAKLVKEQMLSDNMPDALDLLLHNYTRKHGDTRGNTTFVPKCYSCKKVPFQLNICHQSILAKSGKERFQIDDHGISNLSVYGHCSCEEPNYVTTQHEANIITPKQLLPAKVYNKKCLVCLKEILYDGAESCLLNMGKYLVCWEILRTFMSHFLFGSSTMVTSYEVLLRQHKDTGNHQTRSNFSYYHFRWSWYSFLSLLDVNYESAFGCDECKGEVIVCDATTLSFRRELLSWKEYLGKPVTVDKSIKCDKRFKKRILIPVAHLRKTIYNFAASKKGFMMDMFSDMIENCDVHVKELGILLKDVSEEVDEHMRCPPVWSCFIQNVSKASPVCALFHPSNKLSSLLLTLKKEDLKRNVRMLRELQTEVPILFDLVTKLEIIPDSFYSLLDILIERANAPFVNKPDIGTSPIEESSLCFYPQMPLCRDRGIYGQDATGWKGSCTKLSKGHPTLLPGIFTAYCPHGKCYGFEVMKVHESPNTPFTFLRSRCKDAPKIVIYDNACNLHAYCLNRDPLFFKNTWFLIDSLHWCNHKACHEGYCLKKYPQFQDINSQVVEQSNSLLKRIKNMVSYMNQDNFISHVKLYLWARNIGFPKN